MLLLYLFIVCSNLACVKLFIDYARLQNKSFVTLHLIRYFLLNSFTYLLLNSFTYLLLNSLTKWLYCNFGFLEIMLLIFLLYHIDKHVPHKNE